ncbi:MAG: hypothetical protein WC685_10930 [Methylobacter sp.]|jgi:hypothetical protein
MISNCIKNTLQAKNAVDDLLGKQIRACRIDRQKADIIEYIENGLNIIAVAKLIDCNHKTLSKWLVQNQSDTDIQKALIIALIKEPKGLGNSGIAQHYHA